MFLPTRIKLRLSHLGVDEVREGVEAEAGQIMVDVVDAVDATTTATMIEATQVAKIPPNVAGRMEHAVTPVGIAEIPNMAINGKPALTIRWEDALIAAHD